MVHDKGLKSEQGIKVLEEVRRICSALPEVEEISTVSVIPPLK